MVIYECNRCTKIFNDKSKYTKHINRKIPCCPIFKDYENQKNKLCLEEHIQSDSCKVDNNMTNNKSLENTDEVNDVDEPNKIDKVKVLSDLIDYLYNTVVFRKIIINIKMKKIKINCKIFNILNLFFF